jgi:lipopolysaccharide cholinephosphotransferase
MIINYIEYYGFAKGYDPEKWFGKGYYTTFGTIDVNIPYEYDNYLKKMYGNYMQYPPLNERISHHRCEYVNLHSREEYNDILKKLSNNHE